MKKLGLLFGALLSLLFPVHAFQDLDLIVAGDKVVDGAGNPWYKADVGIRDGAIVEIGDLHGRKTKSVLEAKGRLVTPGFIDMMSGTSAILLRDPAAAQSKLQQGITTIMCGEGGSDAPQTEAMMNPEDLKLGLRWRTFGELFQLLEKCGIPLNVVHNVGAAQVRAVVMGVEDRLPTSSELAAMKEHVAQAMRDGAVGLSTALIYPPGPYAKTDELVELAKVAGEYGGFYATHMRNESSGVLNAIREALEIGEKARLPVHTRVWASPARAGRSRSNRPWDAAAG